MELKFTPSPEYFICAKKEFLPAEEHVTRIYERSVLILMISGTLKFLESGKEIVLKKSDYYIQQQHLLQEGLSLDDPPIYYYVEFSGSFSEGDHGLPIKGRFDEKRLLPYAERLCAAAKDKSKNFFYLSSYMNRIFGELMSIPPTEHGTAQRVKDYIESNYASEITLASVAARFGDTKDHIERVFKKRFGISLHSHLISVRLEHAMWLLENSDISVERISSAVGYKDFSSFWRAFKKEYSISPSQARAKSSS